MRPIRLITIIMLRMAFLAFGQETDTTVSQPDSLQNTLSISDSAAGEVDSLSKPPDPVSGGKIPATVAVKPSVPESFQDSFSVFSSSIGGIGVGLSLGSLPPLKSWKDGLPKALADVGLSAGMVDDTGDTVQLQYKVKESPDDYNMMFPLSISFGRLSANHRFSALFTFAMLSKKYNAAVEVDSSRNVTVGQRMRYFSLMFELNYGTRIPERYFSVDKVDRTDAIIGIGLSPLIALKKSSSIKRNSSDALLETVADSISGRQSSFSASGIALAWRLGMVTLRRVSKTGGIEAGLSYQGLWCTRFTTPGGTLRFGDITMKSSTAEKSVSWFSSRFDITISLIHRLF
jgi:hypothetical protein